MPRGVKVEHEYTGKAAKFHDKVVKLEAELKDAKEELKVAYKAQLQEEKASKKAASKAEQAEILRLIKESGKSKEEIIAALKG